MRFALILGLIQLRGLYYADASDALAKHFFCDHFVVSYLAEWEFVVWGTHKGCHREVGPLQPFE
jgi:hypothetical protein